MNVAKFGLLTREVLVKLLDDSVAVWKNRVMRITLTVKV